MIDEEETAEPVKTSKRDRLKGALSRTKTKLKKKEAEQAVDDDVEDFLAAGRTSTSTGRPSISDSLTFATPPSDPLSTSDSPTNIRSTQVPVRDPFVPPPQQSPRRIVVPRIDVSNSQRYPSAQPLPQRNEQARNDFLQPQYHGRSQSVSSLSKGRGRARGLSVTFTEAPPVVIGEGGDEAQTPPIEVSKARVRARSVSPTPTPRSTGPVARLWSRSPVRRKPIPEPVVSPVQEEGDFISPGIRRVQTGISSPAIESKQALEREFEMSLGLGSASTTSPGSAKSPGPPVLHAPKPVHPPVPIPPVRNIPGPHELKPAHGDKNLRSRFEQDQTSPPDPFASPQDPFADPSDSASTPRYYQMQFQGQRHGTRQVPEQRGRTGPSTNQRSHIRSPQDGQGRNWI